MPGDQAVLAAYRATRWTVDTPFGPVLLRPGRPVQGDALRRPAAVVTAYNPASELRSRDENRKGDAALETALRASGAEYYRSLAHGSGPNAEEWDEPGFAIAAVSLEHAVALAEAFGQNAILWIPIAGVPQLVSTRSGFAGSRLGAIL